MSNYLKYEVITQTNTYDYGKVVAINADNTVDVNIGNGVDFYGNPIGISNITIRGFYIPKIGDYVCVEWEHGIPVINGSKSTNSSDINYNTTINTSTSVADKTIISDHISGNLVIPSSNISANTDGTVGITIYRTQDTDLQAINLYRNIISDTGSCNLVSSFGITGSGNTSVDYIDSHVINGYDYYYWASSVNFIGQESVLASSNPAYVTVGNSILPNAPSGLVVVGGWGRIDLSWIAPYNKEAKYYKVLMSDYSDFNIIATANTFSTMYTDFDRNNTDIRYYRIYSVDIYGNESSGYLSGSGSAVMAGDSEAPQPPTDGSYTTDGEGRIILSFTGSTSGDTLLYRTQRYTCTGSDRSGVDSGVELGNISHCGIVNHSVVDSYLEQSKYYYYNVYAIDNSGLMSDELVIPTTGTIEAIDSTPPDIPVINLTEEKIGSITIGWSGSTNVSYYKIYRYNSGGTGEEFLNTSFSLKFTDASMDIDESSSYQYKVSAVDSWGNESNKSAFSGVLESLVISTSGDDDYPTGNAIITTSANSDGTILISWDNGYGDDNSGIGGFNIWRSNYSNGSGCALIGTAPTEYAYSFTDRFVIHNSVYYYYVTAYDNMANETPLATGGWIVATANNTTIPDAPTDILAYGRLGKIDLTWSVPTGSDNNDIVAYKIQKSINSGNTWNAGGSYGWSSDVVINTNSYSEYDIACTGIVIQDWRYRIASVDTIGLVSVWASSSVPNITSYIQGDGIDPEVPGTPIGSSNYDGSITLQWSASDSSDLSKYRIYRYDSDLNAIFTRSGIAYKEDGTVVSANVPRYEAGKFGNGIMIEEGCINLIPSFPTGWGTYGTVVTSNIGIVSGAAEATVRIANTGSAEGFYNSPIFTLLPGTTYTLSFKYRGTVGTNKFEVFILSNTGTPVQKSSVINVLSDFARKEITFTTTSNISGNNQYMRFDHNGNDAGYIEVAEINLIQKPYYLSFPGYGATRTAEALKIPASGTFNKGNWSVELTFEPKSAQNVTYNRLFKLAIDSGNIYSLLTYDSVNGGFIRSAVVSSGVVYGITSSVLPTTGNKYSIMLCGNGSTLRMCVNGELVGTGVAYNEPIGDLPQYLYIGSDDGTINFANGIIDDLRISKIARNPLEHKSHYIMNRTLPVDTYTAYKFDFDDGLYGFDNANTVIEVDRNTLSYTDTGLEKDKIYYYKVSAIDFSGMESNTTPSTSGLVATDSIAPTPPDPIASGGLGLIKLNWIEVSESNVTYEIWRCSGSWSTGSAIKIASVIGGNGGNGAFVDNSPEIDVASTYSYKLKAIDSWNNISDFSTNYSSATSLINEIIVDTTPPSGGTINAPSANSDGTVTISWSGFSDSQSGINGFNVWRSIASTGTNRFIVASLLNSDLSSYIDRTTIHGGTYYYWVTAFDNAGNESETPSSGWKQITALDTTNPIAPTYVSANARSGKIDIVWDASLSSDVVSYELEKSVNTGNTYSALMTVNTNSYSEYDITEESETIYNSWRYRVRAVDLVGLKSSYASSNAPIVTAYFPGDEIDPNAPGTPSGSSNYDGSISVSWASSNSLDLNKYKIYRGDDSFRAVFTRTGNAYTSDWSVVSANVPRYESGNFGKAIMVEEGTTNYISANNQNDLVGWTVSGHTDTTTTVVNPTGGQSKLYTISTGGNGYALLPTPAYANGTATTASIYVYSNKTYNFKFRWSGIYATIPVVSGTWTRLINNQFYDTSKAYPDRILVGYRYTEDGATTIPSGMTVAYCMTQLEQKYHATTFAPNSRGNEVLRIPLSDEITPTGLTIEMWSLYGSVQKDNQDLRNIFRLYRIDNDSFAVTLRFGSGNTLDLYTQDDVGAYSNGSISNSYIPDGWNYIATTVESSNAKVYINGILRLTLANPKLPTTYGFGDYASIGVRSDSNACLSTLHSDVKLTNRVKTATEIGNTYSGGTSIPDADGWKFNFEDNLYGYTPDILNIAEVDKNTLRYIDTGLKNGDYYHYMVSSIDNSGMESVKTNSSGFMLATDSLAPTPPTPTCVGDYGAIRLNWTEVSEKNVTYEIWRCSGGTWTTNNEKIASVIGGNNGTGVFIDLEPSSDNEETYSYKLKTIDSWGNVSDFSTNYSSATSLVYSFSTDTIPPSGGSVVITASANGSIVVTWSGFVDDIGLQGYNIYRNITNNSGNAMIINSLSTTGNNTYVDTTTVHGTSYYYWVSAFDKAGNEGNKVASDPNNISANDTTYPNAPSGITATGKKGGVELIWSASTSPDVVAYEVQKSVNTGNTFSYLAKVNTNNYIEYNVIEASGTIVSAWRYRVRSYDTIGLTSNVWASSSAPNCVSYKPGDGLIPNAPTNVTGSSNYNGAINLAWTVSTSIDAASYRIYRSGTGDSAYNNITEVASTKYTDQYLKNGVYYYYKITTIDNDGSESGYSNIWSGLATDSSPPSTGGIGLVASGTLGAIRLTWNEIPEIGIVYDIWRRDSDTWSDASAHKIGSVVGSNVLSGNNNTFTDFEPSANTAVTYSYKLKATDSWGNITGFFPNTAAVGTSLTLEESADTTPPNQPTSITTSSNSDGSISITWTGSSSSDTQGYNIWRGTSAAGANKILLGTNNSTGSSALKYLDYNVVQSSVYYYYVTAFDQAGNENTTFSTFVAGTSNCTDYPALPSAFNVIYGRDGCLDIKWNKVSGNVVGYRLQKSIDTGNTWTGWGADVVVNTNNYIEYGVTANVAVITGGAWKYRVRSINTIGLESSNWVTGNNYNCALYKPGDLSAPAAPDIPSGSGNYDGSIKLSWTHANRPADNYGYRIYRAVLDSPDLLSGNGSFEVDSNDDGVPDNWSETVGGTYMSMDNEHVFCGVNSYKTYCSASSITPIYISSQQINVIPTANYYMSSLVWIDSSNYLNSPYYHGKITTNLNQVGYTSNSAIKDGWQLVVAEKEYNAGDTYIKSNPYFYYPANSEGRFWLDKVELRQQNLEYRHVATVESSNATSYLDTGLENGKIYYYKISAIDNSGMESSLTSKSNAVMATDFVAPNAVTDIVATGGFGAIILNWLGAEEVGVRYEIWRSKLGTWADSEKIATVVGSISGLESFTDYEPDVSTITTWYYKLKSIDSWGNVSRFSSVVSGTSLVDFSGTIGGDPWDELSKYPATFVVGHEATSYNYKSAHYYVPSGSTNSQNVINQATYALPRLDFKSGNCRSGGSTWIKLSAYESGENDTYNEFDITILTGNAAGQTKRIIDYTGSSRTAVISGTWGTIPASGNFYSLKSPTGKVVLLEGVYETDNSIYLFPNTCLDLSNNATIRAKSGCASSFDLIKNKVKDFCDGIYIKGGTLDGNYNNNIGTFIKGLHVSGGIIYNTRIKVEGTRFINFNWLYALYYNSVYDYEIEGCIFENNYYPVFLNQCGEGIVNNNVIVNNSGGIYFNGNSGKTLVTNNKVLYNSGCVDSYGIKVDGGDVTIRGNIINGNGSHGILLFDSYRNTIYFNDIQGNGSNAANTYSGIFISGTNASNNLLQLNNIVHGGLQKYGIYIYSGNANIVTNNILPSGGLTGKLYEQGATNTITDISGNYSG